MMADTCNRRKWENDVLGGIRQTTNHLYEKVALIIRAASVESAAWAKLCRRSQAKRRCYIMHLLDESTQRSHIIYEKLQECRENMKQNRRGDAIRTVHTHRKAWFCPHARCRATQCRSSVVHSWGLARGVYPPGVERIGR